MPIFPPCMPDCAISTRYYILPEHEFYTNSLLCFDTCFIRSNATSRDHKFTCLAYYIVHLHNSCNLPTVLF